jgi:hypothetical protein
MGHIYLGDIAGIVIGNSIPGGEDAPMGRVCIEDVGTSAKLSFVEDQEATRFIILALPKYADRETIGRHCLDLIKPKSRVLPATSAWASLGGSAPGTPSSHRNPSLGIAVFPPQVRR